jgi:hypothetical protein
MGKELIHYFLSGATSSSNEENGLAMGGGNHNCFSLSCFSYNLEGWLFGLIFDFASDAGEIVYFVFD